MKIDTLRERLLSTTPKDAKQHNEQEFYKDGIKFLQNKTSVNPFVSSMTCYGVAYRLALQIISLCEIDAKQLDNTQDKS